MSKDEKIYYLVNSVIAFLLIISSIIILIYLIPDVSLISIYIEETSNYRSSLLIQLKVKTLSLFIPSLLLFCLLFFLLVYLTNPSKKKEISQKNFTHLKSQVIKIPFFLILVNCIINLSFLTWRLNNSLPAVRCATPCLECCMSEYYYFQAMEVIWNRYIVINALMLVMSIVFLSLVGIESKLNEKLSEIPYRIISYK